jgi:hypothetical protein
MIFWQLFYTHFLFYLQAISLKASSFSEGLKFFFKLPDTNYATVTYNNLSPTTIDQHDSFFSLFLQLCDYR